MKNSKQLAAILLPLLLSSCAIQAPSGSQKQSSSNSVTSSEISSSLSTNESKSITTEEFSSTSTSVASTTTQQHSSEITSEKSGDSQTSQSSNTTGPSFPHTSEMDSSETTSESDITEVDNSKVKSISLDKKELVLYVNKTYSLIVNYTPEDLSLEDKEVSWESSDSSVASVSQYGVVKGIKKGSATIICTSIESGKRARCDVTVIDQNTKITKKWMRVSNPNDFVSGDIVVIGSPQGGMTATAEHAGMYLHPAASTFSSSGDEITQLNELSDQYMLNKDDEGWTLEGEEGKYLATTHTGKITYILKTGNVHWDIDPVPNNPCLSLTSTSNIQGWMMYNSKYQKFTTYMSDEQIDMFVICLYKLVKQYSNI